MIKNNINFCYKNTNKLVTYATIAMFTLIPVMSAHADKTTVIKPSASVDAKDDTTQEATDSVIPLLVQRMPTESELSIANRELLTKNARLEREVNDLQTQVNVLVNERSGQLFMYGVMTALGSFFVGGVMFWFFLGRRKSW